MKKNSTKPSTRFSSEILNEYHELLLNPNLIGVAFFIKYEDQVILLGDMSGCGLAGHADTLYEAIETLDSISRIRDTDIVKKFGSKVVSLPQDDEELISKTAAIESLRAFLQNRPGVLEVKGTPTSIAVVVSGEGSFEGPWEWEGYSVYAETTA